MKENFSESMPSGSMHKANVEETDIEKLRGGKDKVLQAWIFFVALSFHSLFDGLSLGATSDSNGFYAIMIAVLAHKGLDGFALGVPLFYAKLGTCHTVAAILFSCLTCPLGIYLGIIFTEAYTGITGQLVKGLILSMSCGSFIFISLVEMLPAGLALKRYIPLKLALVFFGWGLMAYLALYV